MKTCISKMYLIVNWNANVYQFLTPIGKFVETIRWVRSYILSLSVVPKCSHWIVDNFIFFSSQMEVIYLEDFVLSEDKEIDINYSTAIYIPPLFFPTRSVVVGCYLHSIPDIYSIFFTDAINSSFTSLYHVMCVAPFASSTVGPHHRPFSSNSTTFLRLG